MSASSFLLIAGNQLFPMTCIKKTGVSHVFMAEDKGLCQHYKYHKHKIILFLSAMRKYAEHLQKNNFKVSYYRGDHPLFSKSFEEKLSKELKENKHLKKMVCFEIEDKFFEDRVILFCKKKKLELEFLPSPMFMVKRQEFQTYLSKSKKPFMKTFYQGARKKFSVLLDDKNKPEGGRWSYDQENRKKLPKTISPPELPKVKLDKVDKEVMAFVDLEFSDHPGRVCDFWLPTTRRESLKWLDIFIKTKLENFGAYQDAISQRSDFVFHSVLSPMINMGLILPNEVVERLEKAYHSAPEKYPLNSVEGCIRQVLGWREFVRGIYQNYSTHQWETNYWKNQKKLGTSWYEASTGIPPLDGAILKAQTFSYGHHIERLMVLSNMMLLCEIHPHEVYRWFMEMYADSSDWVMGPNVFGMGQFSDGGLFATKPYICGSNYYLKMGDYKKGEWCETVDGLYWRFINKHISFYKKNPRMAVMVKYLDKMPLERKKNIFEKAELFIKENTYA